MLPFQKTDENLKRFIEGLSTYISADKCTTGFSIKKRHIYTNLMQQSIIKTAKMVAFLHAEVCVNMEAVQISIEHSGVNQKYEEAY